MPQIPSLPIDEPVAQPKASPAEFGSVGETIAGMGSEVQQMAMGNMAFEGHLAEAQRYLKYKQIEIEVGRLEVQAQEDLRKTVTPEDAQAVHAHFKEQVDNTLSPYMADKVLARQLHLYGQEVDVTMQHTVNARKATIIQHSDEAANQVIYKNSLQEAINLATAGNDPKIARDKLEAKLQSSVYFSGTMYPDQLEKILQRFDSDVDKGTIKAKYNSPDPTVRKQVIEQLRRGTDFPHLDDADINALLTSAEKRDRELSNLAMSENYNAAVNHFDELTAGLSYESKVKMLNDRNWLKSNGFVDENGEPDRKTADKLLEEADRQETRSRRIQTDKDNEVIDKHISDADTGRLSVPQIDKIVREEGGSPKAASTLKSALHQHLSEFRAEQRFGEYMAGASERKEHRDSRQEGDKYSAEVFRRLDSGESINMSEVWDKVDAGEMTVSQARKIDAAMKQHKSADYKENLTRIVNAPGLDDATKGKLGLQLLDATSQQKLQGAAMRQYTDQLLQDAGKKQTDTFINRLWNSVSGGGPLAADKPETSSPTSQKRPDGATLKVPDRNGKMHWSNEKHEDLGLVQP